MSSVYHARIQIERDFFLRWAKNGVHWQAICAKNNTCLFLHILLAFLMCFLIFRRPKVKPLPLIVFLNEVT